MAGDLEQHQLLAQALLVLAQRIDPPPTWLGTPHQTDLPPTIFGDALKKQEVIAIFHI